MKKFTTFALLACLVLAGCNPGYAPRKIKVSEYNPDKMSVITFADKDGYMLIEDQINTRVGGDNGITGTELGGR